MSNETELAFVARLRDEATRQARGVRSTLQSIGGRTRPLETALVVRDDATRPLAGVERSMLSTKRAANDLARGAGRDGLTPRFKSAGDAALNMAKRVGSAAGTVKDRLGDAGNAAGRFASRASAGFRGVAGNVAKIGGVAVAGLATTGLLAVGGALAGGIREAAAYQQVTKVTAAVIRSTGGAARVSVPHVKELAGSVESLTGVDENLVIAGENVLLTFKNVRNEVGRGNDVFDQATSLGADMAVVLGQDVKASAMQLGKALNDPVKGVTALQRVGVSFTAQQKTQIATLVKSGRTLDAQKIILGELKSEFGGAAKAGGSGFTGAIARAKDAVADLFRDLLVPAIPMFTRGAERAADVVSKVVAPALKNVGKQVPNLMAAFREGDLDGAAEVLDNMGGNTGRLIGPFRALLGVGAGVVRTLRGIAPAVVAIVGAALPTFGQLAGFVERTVLPALAEVATILTTYGVPAFTAIAGVLGHDVLPAVAALASGLIADLLPIVRDVARFVSTTLVPIFVDVARFVGGTVVPVVSKVAHAFAVGLGGAIRAVTSSLREHEPQIRKVITAVTTVAGVVLRVAGPVLGWLARTILPLVGKAIGLTIGLLAKIVDAITWVVNAARTVGQVSADTFRAMMRVAGNMAAFVIGKVVRPMVDAFLGFAETLVGAAASAFGWVPGLGGKLKAAKAAVEKFRNDTTSTLDAMATAANAAGEEIGGGVGKGVTRGIRAEIGAVAAESQRMAHAAKKAAADELQIASPSKAFEELGSLSGRGMAGGFRRDRTAVRAASELAARVTAAARPSLDTLGALADVQARRDLGVVIRSTSTVEAVIRHEVTFRGDAPDGLTAADVADVIARDPQSAARLEASLLPVRGRIEHATIRPSK